ncbi:MAG: hypothetical protein WD058_06485 [Dehalococcoidia bacterium]
MLYMTRLRSVAFALLLAAAMVALATTAASAHHRPCHKEVPCEVPEVPWTLLMPVAGAGIAGGYYLVRRVRHQSAATDGSAIES